MRTCQVQSQSLSPVRGGEARGTTGWRAEERQEDIRVCYRDLMAGRHGNNTMGAVERRGGTGLVTGHDGGKARGTTGWMAAEHPVDTRATGT